VARTGLVDVANRRYKHNEQRAIRTISDALIDESGDRWDRVNAGEHYCLHPDEYEPYVSRAERFVEMSHRNAPRPIDLETFRTLASARPGPEHVCVQVFERSGDLVIGIDTSDCPA
jgi:hypothetical protein